MGQGEDLEFVQNFLFFCLVVATGLDSVSHLPRPRASGLALNASSSPSRQQRALATQLPPCSFLPLEMILELPPSLNAGATEA